MRVLVVIDHPWEQSFNYALMTAFVRGLEAAGHEVDRLDLHADGFDPVMRREELAVYTQGTVLDPQVRDYQARIMQAAHLAFFFPVWWEVMPAMLKGWMDKVFTPEWAFTEADATPLLTHITGATVVTTMGAPEITFNSVEPVLCKGTLGFCGITNYRWVNFLDVGNVAAAQRRTWLDEVELLGRGIK